MNKLIIENILIEKSEKDIETGKKYVLSDGFNLIYGNNEAGKSSLMSFIKNGFFKTKGNDTGKIYFKLFEKEYRADIKDSKKTDDRCKLHDEAGNICDYALIKENIKQKYFEEGFTIDLDDLMKIQNKNTDEFINIIKDPSGDKLNEFLEKIKNEISANLGLDGKLKKNTKEITDKISVLNRRIKELSRIENDYNLSIASIKLLNEEIQTILNEEENLKKYKEYLKLSDNIKELTDEKETAQLSFNKKLFEAKDCYFDLIQELGKYSLNKEIITKNNQKLEIIRNKILDDKTRLNIECGLSLSENIINSFEADYEKTKKIKELLETSEQIIVNIKADEQKIEDLEDELLKLKCEIETILKNKEEKCNFEQLEAVTKALDEGLRQYHFLSSEIDNVKKEEIINAPAINNNKKLRTLLIILFALTIICAIISFCQHIQTAGIFSVLIAILSLAGYSSLKLGSYEDNKDSEKERIKEQRNLILADLKEKVKPFYAEIDSVEISYLPLKLDSIKQELTTNLKDFKTYNELLLKYTSDRNYTEEKLLNLRTKISNANHNLEQINEEIKNLSDKNISNEIIFGKKYLEAVEIVKALKEDLESEKILKQELQEVKESNEKILSQLKSFIIENNVDITICENVEEITIQLSKHNENNNTAKQQIDALNAQINSLQKRAEELGKIKETNISEEELSVKKEEKIKQKKEAEFTKRELEKVEGISDLKTQKNILIEEYRNVIKNLFVNKMTLELTNTAKAEFDKTQPDIVNAQKFLAILTDNKYCKINLEMQEIENEDGTKIKKWEHLSRGTKEQLYLALRLGYASNYAKDKITLEPNGKPNLPLIVDDAFVNFDQNRTKNALKCLCEFSKTNQVLFFTCHSSMIKGLLEEISCETNTIQL